MFTTGWLRHLQAAVGLLVLAAALAAARADVQPESTGRVEVLPQPFGAHWVWVSDFVLERSALIDLDQGRFLGLINGGYGPIAPMFARRRDEIYLPATYYSRRTHGERTDVLEIYDARTLGHAGEVALPPKRATNAIGIGQAGLSDDDRFVAVFNWTTGTSLTIVDAERRTVTADIQIPGCSLVYAAGTRRFISLCGDGALLTVTVDDAGRELSKTRTAPFFDPRRDPVTEKAVRVGTQWIFVSFEGQVHPVDVADATPRFPEPWSLVSDGDRAASWRIGGGQHLAAHEPSARLYALMHRGGPDTHKEAGAEVWVYDLRTRQRVNRIRLVTPGLTVYGFPIEFGRDWPAPFNRLCDWLLDWFVPAGVTHMQVTRDDAPLLVTGSQFSGALGVYDARTGAFLRRVLPVGWTSDIILAPWGGAPTP